MMSHTSLRCLVIGAVLCLALSGCRAPLMKHRTAPIVGLEGVPRELDKVTLPAYRVEPPDILSIDCLLQVPDENYRLHEGDTVMLTVLDTLPEEPIAGIFPIEAGGIIRLGFGYDQVHVAGLTVGEASAAIDGHLRKYLRQPSVSLSLRQATGIQRISGEHCVGPDGTVTLGVYGSVSVVGLTLEEVQFAIQEHLATRFASPEVSVSVYSYNSKVYYVITQGGGLGDGLVRLPFTGNETVLDAISQINGLSHVSSTRMWIARPSDTCDTDNTLLPIDWLAITQRGDVSTNYQLLPGDRLYIAHDRLVAIDGALAKVTAPFERIFGVTLLGTTTTSRLSGKVLQKTTANSLGTAPGP